MGVFWVRHGGNDADDGADADAVVGQQEGFGCFEDSVGDLLVSESQRHKRFVGGVYWVVAQLSPEEEPASG